MKAHVCFALVLIATVVMAYSSFGQSATERIGRTRFFNRQLVQVGGQASEQESQTLWELLNASAANNYQSGLTNLEQFLDTHATSPWAPSLDAAIGRHYLNIGRYTLALEHLELAWEATKNYQSGDAKNVADFALAHWMHLLTRLGRLETATTLIDENRNRVLDKGPLSQIWLDACEAVGDMRKNPWHSYQCGTFALDSVAQNLRLQYDKRTLTSRPSPTNGFSMKVLADLSRDLGLGLVPVLRVSGTELPVPCVVHWQQNHYAAIIAERNGIYRVADPTFGRPRLMKADTINAEASGAFLILNNAINSNFRTLSENETSAIFGRGNPNFFRNGDDQGCDGGGGTTSCENGQCPPGTGPDGADATGGRGERGGRGSDGGCFFCRFGVQSTSSDTPVDGAGTQPTGMPVWSVAEPYINLWLEDEPVAYQPALGAPISFKITYKQRYPVDNFGAIHSSVGSGWNCSWISFVESDYNVNGGWGNAYVYREGQSMSSYFFTGANTEDTNYYNNLKLAIQTNVSNEAIGFELRYPSGARDVYGFGITNGSGNFTGVYYLSQRISPQGHVISFVYEPYDPAAVVTRLKYIIDADGQTNTFSYAMSGYSTNLITQVQTPYGQTVSLSYDGSGLLTNITDAAGISSSFKYNGNGWLTNLITPYGTTVFEHVDRSLSNPFNLDRSITITEANGRKQIYAFFQTNQFEPTSYAAAQVPTNTPIGTFDNAPNERNSYYWGPVQCALLSTFDVDSFTTNDFRLARMRHWLGATTSSDHDKTIDTLSLERDPTPDGSTEGQKTWYDYPNKGLYGSLDKPAHILPGDIARVMPDGSTWYQHFERNRFGKVTQSIEKWVSGGSTYLRTNRYFYSADGVDLLAHTNALGVLVVSNVYNAYHLVTTSYDALGQVTTYSYNSTTLQLTNRVTAAGLTNSFSYSGNRLLSTADQPIGRTRSYTWYSNGNLESLTDERGMTVTNYWDGLNRLIGTKYPDGTTTTNIYTILDLTETIDRMNHSTYFAYDSLRRKIAETNANNVVTRWGYCECGSVASVTNAWNTAIQQVTTYTHDYQGRLTMVQNADGYSVTNWYNALGKLTATGDGWGNNWFGYDYDNIGLLTSVTNGLGALQKRTVYDLEDQPTIVTDANGVTITNYYDDLGRLTTRTYADGGTERFGYSARGLVAYTNQLNQITRYVYDEAGRKLYETNANSEVIRFSYNAASDLLVLIDGKNQTNKWNYDLFGRVTNKIDQAEAEILRYQYDADNRLTNRWSAAVGDTHYSYDNVGNLTFVDYSDGLGSYGVTYGYDALNRMTNMVDGVGTTKFAYTAGNQLLTEDGPFASDTLTNTYANRLRTRLDLQQTTGRWTNVFGYDAAKRLTNVISPAGSFEYTYINGASRLPKRVLLPSGAYITNTYDLMARLTATDLDNSGGTVLDSAAYGYNTGNQRIAFTNAAGTPVSYAYDNIGQLKSADSSLNSEDRGYLYDAAWNLTSRTNNGVVSSFTVDVKNQLNSTPLGTATYDNNGNLSELNDGITQYQYTYDDENQLIAAQLTGSWRVEFSYDGLGRLRHRQGYFWTELDPGIYDWLPNAEVYYIYDGRRVIQERSAVNQPTVGYTRGIDLSGTMEGAGGIGGLLARSHGYSSGNLTNHSCYHADGNGNVTYMINSSQSMVASYRYDPFGNTISSSGTLASANVYRFSSKEIHVDSGLYYYGYRFYAPHLQRWMNREPLGEVGLESIRRVQFRNKGFFANAGETIQGPSLYHFVFNNPLNYYDLLGLDALTGYSGTAVPNNGRRPFPIMPDPESPQCRAAGVGGLALLLATDPEDPAGVPVAYSIGLAIDILTHEPPTPEQAEWDRRHNPPPGEVWLCSATPRPPRPPRCAPRFGPGPWNNGSVLNAPPDISIK